MDEMEGVSGAPLQGDVGLTGLKVLEHLQTLKVACEGTCPPGLAREEGASCPPPEGRSAASHPEGLPTLPEAALHGGDGQERLPLLGSGDAAMEEEPPLLGSRRSSSERGWTWPALNSGAGVEPVPGFGEGGPETPAGGAQEVKEELPPPPPNSCGGSSSLLVSDGDLTQGELAGKSASQTSEKLPEAVPAAPGKETEESAAGSSGSTASSSESESESESDTDTDSSSSVSSSSSCLPSLSEDDEQQCKKEKNSGNTRKKGESTEKDSPNIEELTIILPESVELMPFGKVSSIIEHQVIIESEKGLPPVNEDTVFFKDDHHSIGKVFEVFGPVSHPFYVLQFNSPEHIESKGIKIHDAVYFAPSVESFTQYIFPEKLKQERGSDASWKNDEEPPPEMKMEVIVSPDNILQIILVDTVGANLTPGFQGEDFHSHLFLHVFLDTQQGLHNTTLITLNLRSLQVFISSGGRTVRGDISIPFLPHLLKLLIMKRIFHLHPHL
nr:H/ACA ribonucleoprotein complex non-core subunit NAF1 isoform X3 [Pogona vitticeps]